ncbi:MAG: tyrosine--tRNA ligase [Phycisphaeraceae bacterium]|nr:tyrosine--tRNA ligase [Phycisphaeraceae bacterium]
MPHPSETTGFPDLLSELRWRGLLHQATDENALKEHFATGGRKVYAGFDPTADSLTIGNLVPITVLRHVQRHGHTPIVLMGGATGRIGDPSGKSAERTLMTDAQVDANIASQREIFTRILGDTVTIVNNLDWWKDKSFLWVLREVGKHFSVNVMMQKDSVKSRLESREQGISFTEFSYQILQSYDFLHLAREMGVTVQCGGSDQWGNIIGGSDLIRKVGNERANEADNIIAAIERVLVGLKMSGTARQFHFSMNETRLKCQELGLDWVSLSDPAQSHHETERWLISQKLELSIEAHRDSSLSENAFAFTAPLVTKSDGGKFGKSEAGAVWLSAHRTSPYAFHQFWLNTADADVERFLKMFTFLPKADIERLVAAHGAAPEKRVAQRALADSVTGLVHGKDAVARANAAAEALFSGEVAHLDAATLREVFAAAPSSDHAFSILEADGWSILDALAETGLASSKSQAREFVKGGGVTVNGETKAAMDTRLTRDHLLHGEVILLRRGKKNWHVCKFA